MYSPFTDSGVSLNIKVFRMNSPPVELYILKIEIDNQSKKMRKY